jgi:hypothetical protein
VLKVLRMFTKMESWESMECLQKVDTTWVMMILKRLLTICWNQVNNLKLF